VGRHTIRLEPDAHGKGSGAQDVGPLHTSNGRQPRLHRPHEIVGNLVLLKDIGCEREVRRCELAVGRLHIDGRHLGLRREIPTHLVNFGTDLRERIDRIDIELQAGGNGRQTLSALGGNVVDPVGRGDGPLQWSSDKAAHQLGAGTDINGGDRHRGIIAAGILAHVQCEQGLKTDDGDDQAYHGG
jgi:hypothetical protein